MEVANIFASVDSTGYKKSPVAAKIIGAVCVLMAGVLSKAFVYIFTAQSISGEARVTDTSE